MKATQKGMGHLGLILGLVVVVGILGFVGWRVWSANSYKKSDTSPKVSTAVRRDEQSPQKTDEYQPIIPSGWKVYENSDYGFSFAYPTEWGELSDDTFPGGGYDATKDWLLHKKASDVKELNDNNMYGNLILEVNSKSYQEFRTGKAQTPHVYAVRDGKEMWEASGTVDVEFDDYEPGDPYVVPIEKKINGTNIYRIYSGYEEVITAGWRFPTDKGIVTIWLPRFIATEFMTGEIVGDESKYKQLAQQVLDSINLQ